MEKVNLKRYTISGLGSYLSGLGLKSYRPSQVARWLYQKGAASLSEMTDLSMDEREMLDRAAYIGHIEFVKSKGSVDTYGLARWNLPSEQRERGGEAPQAPVKSTKRARRALRGRLHPALPVEGATQAPVIDGTRKFLFKLEDGNLIESVLIPDGDRMAYCVSTQAGCAMGCRFCLTGRSGLKRNLYPDEIVDQIIFIRGMLSGDAGLTNIVMMGMGEPFANTENLLKAIDIITHKDGLAISPRRITISTSGIIPGIEELGRQKSHINLAVSLNSTTDEQRSYLMPVNRRYPLQDLISALRRYPLPPRRRITFEYILLKGINDSPEDAIRLAGLVRGIRCKINLIPFNSYPGAAFERP
ncbi:MAG: 23S rRNA (adenine(2503)-C(2))-methyltransferase RlmN, partial [Nitrospirota bacterium]